MGFDRVRERFKLPPEIEDGRVMRAAYDSANAERSRLGKKPMPKEVFSEIARGMEGGQAPGPPPRDTAPGQTGAPTAPARAVGGAAPILNAVKGVGNFVKDAVVETGKDVQGLAMGLTVDPLAQMGRAVQQRRLIVEPTPEEADRAKRGLALLAGGAAGGVAGKAIPAGANLLGRMMRGAGAGAAGGGVDAGIRSGGDPRATLGGAALGGALGGAIGGVIGRGTPPRAAGETVAADPRPRPASGFDSDIPGQPTTIQFNPKAVVRTPEEVAKPGQLGTSHAELDAERMQMALARGETLPPITANPERAARTPTAGPPLIPSPWRGVNNIFSPIKNRVRAAGEQGQTLRRMLDDTDDEGIVEAGKVIDDLEQAGVADPRGFLDRLLGRKGGISDEQDRLVSLARRGYVDRGTLDPEAQKALKAVDDYLNPIPGRTREVGLKAQTRAGTKHDIPDDPSYLRETVPSIAALSPSRFGFKKPIRQSVIRDLMDTKKAPDEQAATDYVNDYVLFAKSRGKRGGDLVAQRMVDEGQAADIATAKGKLARHLSESRINRSSSLEHAREVRTGIFDPSVKRTLPAYAQEVEGRIAEARHLGPEMEAVDRIAGTIDDAETRQTVQLLIKRAREAGEPEDSALERVMLMGRRIGTSLLSPTSTVKNLGQFTNPMLRTDIPSTLKAIVKSGTEDAQRFALRSGATTSAALRQSQHGVADTGGVVDAYLRTIGFTRAEKWLRTVAANSARFYAEGQAKNAGKGSAFAQSELRRLRLDPDAIAARGGKLTEDELLKAGKIVSDETQFRARPMDLPEMMTRNPVLKNAAQFKSFISQQTQLLKTETVDRILTGNPAEVRRGLRNIAILGTVYPMTGEAINNLVALIQGKERDSEGLTRYLENLVTPGGAGIAADIFGALERGNFPEWAAGPTVGRFGKLGEHAVNAAGRLAEGEALEDALTTSEKRNAARQIPGIGPLIANRRYPADE